MKKSYESILNEALASAEQREKESKKLFEEEISKIVADRMGGAIIPDALKSYNKFITKVIAEHVFRRDETLKSAIIEAIMAHEIPLFNLFSNTRETQSEIAEMKFALEQEAESIAVEAVRRVGEGGNHV